MIFSNNASDRNDSREKKNGFVRGGTDGRTENFDDDADDDGCLLVASFFSIQVSQQQQHYY